VDDLYRKVKKEIKSEFFQLFEKLSFLLFFRGGGEVMSTGKVKKCTSFFMCMGVSIAFLAPPLRTFSHMLCMLFQLMLVIFSGFILFLMFFNLMNFSFMNLPFNPFSTNRLKSRDHLDLYSRFLATKFRK